MNKIIFGLLFFTQCAHSNELLDSRKVFAECRIKLSAKVSQSLNGSIIPALKKVSTPAEAQMNFFEHTQNVGYTAVYFPPAALGIPFALLADILISPVKGISKIASRIDYKKKSKLSEKEFEKATEDFKKEWEKIEPNAIKRHLIINELYDLSFISDVHSWLVNENAKGTIENRRDYNFIIPYIYKNLGQEPKFIDGDWKIKSIKRGTTNLYMYFHIEDFRKILQDNPKLCDSPGLDALEVIGKGYADRIKAKMLLY